jgi:hypothetical protein
MSMMRKESAGDYQIGIWSVTRNETGRGWTAVATGPGTLGDGSPQQFPTLRAAYLELTGEPLDLIDGSMKTTIDTYTGKRFRWNETVFYAGFVVPARCTSRTAEHLHPHRVPAKLLARLNPSKVAG